MDSLAGSVRVRELEKKFVRNLLADQKHFWTSPARLKPKDAIWLAPAGAFLGVMLHRDRDAYHALSPSAAGDRSRLFSNVGVASLAGGVVSMYAWGRMTNNDHARETGILSTQAAIGALAMGSALKYSLARARPESARAGDFFQYGEGSFPSNHAMLAWSMATVVAHEYDGPLTKLGAYGLASAVSVARVSGRRHFVSDVVIGSALGYAIGRQVYKRHHDAELPGMNIGTFVSDPEPGDFRTRASSYVPLDSWVYPALERLQGLGFSDSTFLSLRPWTRLECARAILEVEAALAGASDRSAQEGDWMIPALKREFAPELAFSANTNKSRAYIESIYVRGGGTAGPPLTDGYHFGRTSSNDFGRPDAEGGGLITGLSTAATYGRWAFYVRGEYQTAGAIPALAPAVAAEIARVDNVPLETARTPARSHKVRLLDAYVALNLAGWQISAGKQNLWWGPGVSGSLMMSNNVEPFPMVRISRTSPTTLPWVGALLGPWRGEGFIGQLQGHRFVLNNGIQYGPGLSRQPLIHGFKLNFKPTQNLDFGVSVTTIFAGPGVPFNTRTVLRSLGFSNTVPGQVSDPGDRRSGFDFRYRIPGLRKWLTLYNESYAEDEISPLAFPRRSAMNPGLYLSRVPFLPRLDLRAEGFYTDLPNLRGNGFFYYNFRFQSGYTNHGNLLGHPVGRQGSGFMLQSNYWFDPDRRLRLTYTDRSISSEFIPQGGAQKDLTFQAVWALRTRAELSGQVQFETWRFPLLSPNQQRNLSAWVQVTFRPTRKAGR